MTLFRVKLIFNCDFQATSVSKTSSRIIRAFCCERACTKSTNFALKGKISILAIIICEAACKQKFQNVAYCFTIYNIELKCKFLTSCLVFARFTPVKSRSSKRQIQFCKFLPSARTLYQSVLPSHLRLDRFYP